MAKTICMIAEKGGVSRTSTTIGLAGLYASQGAKVLTIDTDPQSSLTKFFMGQGAAYDLPKDETIACLFDDRYAPDPARLIHATNIEGISIAPASDRLKDHNLPKPSTLGELQFALRDFVLDVQSDFDFIFIDCPPDVSNLPTFSSLLASDYALTPIIPEKFSVQAIAGVDAQLAAARENNPKLKFLGYFISQRQARLSLHDVMIDTLRGLQRDRVFDTEIPRAVAIAEAQASGQPITMFDPNCTAAKATALLGAEILSRINNENQARRAA